MEIGYAMRTDKLTTDIATDFATDQLLTCATKQTDLVKEFAIAYAQA